MARTIDPALEVNRGFPARPTNQRTMDEELQNRLLGQEPVVRNMPGQAGGMVEGYQEGLQGLLDTVRNDPNLNSHPMGPPPFQPPALGMDRERAMQEAMQHAEQVADGWMGGMEGGYGQAPQPVGGTGLPAGGQNSARPPGAQIDQLSDIGDFIPEDFGQGGPDDWIQMQELMHQVAQRLQAEDVRQSPITSRGAASEWANRRIRDMIGRRGDPGWIADWLNENQLGPLRDAVQRGFDDDFIDRGQFREKSRRGQNRQRKGTRAQNRGRAAIKRAR